MYIDWYVYSLIDNAIPLFLLEFGVSLFSSFRSAATSGDAAATDDLIWLRLQIVTAGKVMLGVWVKVSVVTTGYARYNITMVTMLYSNAPIAANKKTAQSNLRNLPVLQYSVEKI
jgi:hypothetical protein